MLIFRFNITDADKTVTSVAKKAKAAAKEAGKAIKDWNLQIFISNYLQNSLINWQYNVIFLVSRWQYLRDNVVKVFFFNLLNGEWGFFFFFLFCCTARGVDDQPLDDV